MAVEIAEPEVLTDTQIRLLTAGVEWITGRPFSHWFQMKKAEMPDGVFLTSKCGCVFQIEQNPTGAEEYRFTRVIRVCH